MLKRTHLLLCDGCGRAAPESLAAATVLSPAELRTLARLRGWVVDAETGRDLCTLCTLTAEDLDEPVTASKPLPYVTLDV
jgi:hypothetical protein